MFYREIFRILSSYLLLYTGILAVPFALALYYQFGLDPALHPQPHATWAFAYTMLICLFLAGLCTKVSSKTKGTLYRRESLATAVIIWIVTPLIGGLPFLFSGTLERFDQAFFEAASGFTTTGATVLEAKQYDQKGEETPIRRTYCGMQETTYVFYGNIAPVVNPLTGERLEGIEAVGKALLFWRSLMQWLGGMGILVLFVAFLPELGVNGKFLFQTESPGPIKETLTPRITETAFQLWKIYVGLTIIQILLLLTLDVRMPLLDAVTLSFSTLSTGGFSIHNDNIAYYHSAAVEWIVLAFMILGSLNFSFYYYILKGKFYRLFEPEFGLYLSLLLLLGGFVTWNLVGQPIIALSGENRGTYSFCEALRIGFFQLVSAQTSSGFFTTDYDNWPYSILTITLIVMYLGGMAGSTSGGIKIVRFYMLYEIIKAKIEAIFRPKTIRIVRLGQREIDNGAAISVLCFFALAIAFSVIGTFCYIVDGIDPETALGLTACMINNTGIAFRAAGPLSTLAFLSPFATYWSIFMMILGRLEFYAVLALLIPAFWKENG
ncbi:TrkH family potassium uptake protein [Candidatus Protochlamydia phocaeensis]|uniref:TrkH family potassium uptake protein n=1 Tax=Candidatus Protochlamydia phocaeensis TaxID=1414722 RepID=UPI0008397A0F|nr:TrkH family potassium uptake protein [Candidatus Protochlamydia phocaeensis]